MVDRQQKIVGDGITARVVETESVDFGEGYEGRTLEAGKFFRECVADWRDPWASNAEMFAALKEEYDKVVASQPVCRDTVTQVDWDGMRARTAYYKERETPAWYLRAIQRELRIIDYNRQKGDVSWVAHHALVLGELITELRMKFRWESDALRGEKVAAGGKAARKGDREARIAAVDALVSSGKTKTAAFAKVALSEGVTPKAIQADYYRPKKKPS